MFVYYELFPGSLNVKPFVGPNMNAAKIRQVVKPLIDQLNREGVPHDFVVKDFPTFFELYLDLFDDEGAGANMLVGGRLFSKRDIRENGNGVVDAIRQSLEASQGGKFPSTTVLEKNRELTLGLDIRHDRSHRRSRLWRTGRRQRNQPNMARWIFV